MASGSGNLFHDEGSSSSFNDLVANSSLTATASEFVPNAALRSKGFKKNKFTKSQHDGGPNVSTWENNSDHHHQTNGYLEPASYDRPARRGKLYNRQGGPSSNYDGKVMGDGSYDASTNNPSRGQPSYSSHRFSGKYYSNQRGNSSKRPKDWSAANSANYYPDSHQDEGAVGGEDSKTFQHREHFLGPSKIKDRNGNKDQYLDRTPNHPFFPNNSKFREFREQGGDERPQKKDSIKVFDRDGGARDRSKYWDRSSQVEREPAPYFEDTRGSRSVDWFASNHSDRGQDNVHDSYSSNRQIKRNDHHQERYRDERHRDWNSADADRDMRGPDRFYGSRGSRHPYDFQKEDRRKNNNQCQRERGRSHHFNTQETFGANGVKSSFNDSQQYVKETHGLNHKEGGNLPGPSHNSQRNYNFKDGDDVSQRDRLTEQLSRGTLECLVCCERVRQQDSVWSCSNCFHVLHLRCVIKWAKSSKAETGWRCPACQNVTEAIPSQYRCFCGKILDPQWNRQDTPHTCGEVCGRSREGHRLCNHRCTLLCHPGPCPPCVAQVSRNCGCGKTSQTVKCGLVKPLLCESVCNKLLNCGVHLCELQCHPGPCDPCQHKIDQECFCKKQKRTNDCIPENQDVFQFCCGEVCGHDLACGNHTCEEICHDGECKPCQLTPEMITHCPCGQTELGLDPDQKRKSCADPIPTCGKTCGRKLLCGQPSNPHICKVNCHVGACPPCPLTTMVRCRCGHMDRELPCEQLTSKADDARCLKKCTKKRSCAKHKCNQPCCIEIDHPCPLPCNHTLTCGLHRCEQLCHRGHCKPCWRTSFEELYCECGAEVLYPPVPCGTKPPECTRPCSRQHDCDHPALHSCHSESNCPPCTVLTQKYCYGNHELRKSIPCHQKEFSCGLPCGKELPCGRHKCIQLCHKGDCLLSGVVCNQPCVVPRPTCQHLCSAPCHNAPCPDIPCKERIRVTCECGHRSAMRPCAENTQEYQRIATSLLASKMADVQLGHSIDIGDIMSNPSTKKLYLKSLECNDECKVIERNRRMAIGLQIRNPDISQKLTPRYSDSMRAWAKKDPAFCQNVHDKLTELVKLAKESKQKSRSFSFEVMNRDKRQFVHEYCEHFGCESVAYDQEPKRNVVATAQKAKAWLPSVGLLELVQREAGQRKVPGPMLNSVKKPLSRNMDTLGNKWATKPAVSASSSNSTTPTSSTTSSVVKTTFYSPSSATGEDFGSGGSSGASFIDHFNS